MKNISSVTAKILSVMLALDAIFLAAGLMLFKDKLAFALGLLFGAVFSAAKFIMLERAVSKAVDKSKTDAENYMRFNYFARYFLTLAAAIIGFFVPFFDFFGVIIAIFLLQGAIYISAFIFKDIGNYKKESKTL